LQADRALNAPFRLANTIRENHSWETARFAHPDRSTLEIAMREPNQILTARELMATNLLVFRPEQPILEAIEQLIKRRVSGAPVIDEDEALVGVLSELDCLRMLASDEFYLEQHDECASVRQFMTSGGRTISPDLGIYAISHYFLTGPIRRLPVVEKDKLIGQVSRRDVLRGMEEMSRKPLEKRRYPDYAGPQ
jgi:CBS domain-containing protein